MQGNQHQAKVSAYLGATGSGKTTRMLKALARPKRKRTLIWSPKEAIDNYAALFPGTIVVRTASDCVRALIDAKRGPVHIVFVPKLNRKADEAAFGVVCKAAMLARDITFIADELHTVTKPSWAPDGWSELIMMGRGYGVEVFGLSQRPASVDKDFFSNLSTINVGRLAFKDDVKVVAKTLNLPEQEVAALTGHMWIQRNILTGEIERG